MSYRASKIKWQAVVDTCSVDKAFTKVGVLVGHLTNWLG